MNLILASSSARREELLRAARIPFTSRAADINEDLLPGEAPRDYTQRLAFEKANAVLQSAPGSLVLGADTTVVVDQHILAKPEDAADARRMLTLLSGRKHEVLTSVCLLGTNVRDVRTETTQVHFDRVTSEELDWYIGTGEPMGKAGAYGIQGIASRWVTRIEGCYFNVVGLPVSLVNRMLKDAGFST